MKIRIFYGLVFILVSIFFLRCSGKNESDVPPALQLPTRSSWGVVLHGCPGDQAWLENTNKLAARVRRVWQSGTGEMTQALDFLDAGAKLRVPELRDQHGFYVYGPDGMLVGWISGQCEKQKK